MTNAVTGSTLGNYALAAGSPAIDYIPLGQPTATAAPTTDFFGNPRPATPGTNIDVGAVEFVGGGTTGAAASVTGGPLAFGNVAVGTNSTAQTLTLHNTGSATLTGIGLVFSSPRYSRPGGAAGGTCTATLAAASTCTINVVFHPTVTGLVNATLTINASVPVTGSPVALSGTGARGAVTFGLGAGTTSGVTLAPILGVQTLQFGTRTAGSTTTAVVTLTNTGLAPTTYTASAVMGARFAKGTDTCTGPTPVAVGGVCSITVTFNPDSAAIRLGMLRVTDNATGSPQILPLLGQ